ncbi:chitinase [Priestia megaterium]|uniref:chitinase n=1 Tax=Priestia megaterium TaxID=1404 RepID=UPI0026774373|nr:chitinase [Priestia megaterium]WKU22094.1 chitinase [Priestia megaterium]
MEHKPLLMGYWDNVVEPIDYTMGYKGMAVDVDLIDIPEEYNVIVASHHFKDTNDMYEIPIFVVRNKPDGEFKKQADHLTLKGQKVLYNLRGSYFDSYSWFCTKNYELGQNYLEEAVELVFNGINNIVDTYGISGICLDLERDIFDKKGNKLLIPATLKRIKDVYKREDKDFFICISSYFPDLCDDDKSLPYLAELEGYYDLVCTKLYGGEQVINGHKFNEIGDWISEIDDKQKEDFLYYMFNSLANGTNGFPKIPHDKLVMGLPATESAARKGYVKDPSAVLNALERLKQSGTPIRGLSAYSINWDAGEDKNFQPYSYEFMNRYKGIITPV